MKTLLLCSLLTFSIFLSAQDKNLPYYEIPTAPDQFTAGTVAARVVDGLGFRFYWATEGLREADLAFKPGADARTSQETIEHIFEMSIMIMNAATKTVNVDGKDVKLPFDTMRKKTLENLKTASEKLRAASDAEMKELTVRFKQNDKLIEYPFWNMLNGPIADCLWHVGQVVTFRRSSGNPFTEKVSVFTGTVQQ